MEFHFETAYDQKACTAMVKVMQKTVIKKRSRWERILVLGIVVLTVLWTVSYMDGSFFLDPLLIVNWILVLALVFYMLFRNRINGFFIRKRLHPSLAKVKSTFREDGYSSETEFAKSEFMYENLTFLFETEEYFILTIGPKHGHVLDKSSITGGTSEEFRAFIEGTVGRKFREVRLNRKPRSKDKK